jgi:arginase
VSVDGRDRSGAWRPGRPGSQPWTAVPRAGLTCPLRRAPACSPGEPDLHRGRAAAATDRKGNASTRPGPARTWRPARTLAANPAGAAATALDRLPAGPLAVHIDVGVPDFTGTPLAEDTGGRNTGPALGQTEQALIPAARDPPAQVLPIGELNPARSAADPDALPRSADSIARILTVTGRG